MAPPSDVLVTGRVHGVPVAFLARHARGHRLLPSEVPYRANIHAMKQLGVKYLLSLSAVGSLREDFMPLDMVLPDQFIDLTKTAREHVLWPGRGGPRVDGAAGLPGSGGVLARAVRSVLAGEAAGDKPTLHERGTYVCIEGPQFSSGAESQLVPQHGGGVIGMTAMPEAKLAREAQIAYTTLAMVTDYDCWHPREAHVTGQHGAGEPVQECRPRAAYRRRGDPPAGRRTAGQRRPRRAEKFTDHPARRHGPRGARAPGGLLV